ncbi:MAG: GGDEF domain-containing protein, partial [Candidatus Rifleibacteriota bacterium]
LTDKGGSNALSERDFELAQLICSQLGIALKNANLYKRGITDGLTRLYTNHYFKMRLSQEVSRLRRVKSPLSIIMVGIDNIDKLMDSYGANFKDNILVKIGATIKRVIRFNDLPCRFEGDKFTIILPDTTADGAKTAAEKILENVRQLVVKNRDEEQKVSVSMSITQFKINMNLGQFIEEAEILLGEAQKQGGNRILFSEK